MSELGSAATIFDFPGAHEEIDALYQERGWTDGLPIVPPTEASVAEFLRWTDRYPREVIGVLPPRQGEATVERIAANAVMAGCRPEYFPVILAGIEALTDPLFNLDSIQATTHPVATLLVVNGPIARAIGLNAGYNAFGQGFRANVTIGRAVRLVLMNVGGGLPGTGDRSTQGNPAKIAYCVAENEAENPWEPLHVEAGLPADASVVTAFGCEGPHNIQDHFSSTGLGVLLTVAAPWARPAATISSAVAGRSFHSGPSTRPPSRATATASARSRSSSSSTRASRSAASARSTGACTSTIGARWIRPIPCSRSSGRPTTSR